MLLIGTDEAGYGPNLGPLVVAATAWQLPATCETDDLYSLLADEVSSDPRDRNRLAIADSKKLYHSGDNVSALEKGVLAALSICGETPKRWQDLWSKLDRSCVSSLEQEPWNVGYDELLPLAATTDEVAAAAHQLDEGLKRCDARLAAVRCRILYPAVFNELVSQCGSKGEVLSLATLKLARELQSEFADAATLIHCDKHGGRNRYGALLQPLFPDDLVEVFKESRDLSLYRCGPKARRVEFRFAAKGESFLPSALASMTAKYARELAMRSFNSFWCREVPGVKPTAGYPMDAVRFQNDVAVRRKELAIEDGIFWRSR